MKKIVTSLLFAGCQSTIVVAQDFPTVDSLGLQGAAAFALTGSSPTEISRPTGARQFGLSLFGGTSGEDFAFEISPFWWTDPSVSIPEMVNSGWFWKNRIFAQSFSASGAHYDFETPGGAEATGLSFGVSFDIYRGHMPNKTISTMNDFNTKFVFGKTPSDFPSMEAYQRALKEHLQRAEMNRAFEASKLELDKGRVGWNASFSAAMSYEYSDTKYNDGELAKYGAWLTVFYRADGSEGSEPSPWTFAANTRYLRDETTANNDTFFDFGGRVIYEVPGNMPLTISAEYIKRFADSTDDTERWAVLLEYEVNEDWSLFITHGNNFDDMSRNDVLFTYAGFSFGGGAAPTFRSE